MTVFSKAKFLEDIEGTPLQELYEQDLVEVGRTWVEVCDGKKVVDGYVMGCFVITECWTEEV